MELEEINTLPTPEGLRALAEDFRDDDDLSGFLRTAALEIELSREEIVRLKATLTDER